MCSPCPPPRGPCHNRQWGWSSCGHTELWRGISSDVWSFGAYNTRRGGGLMSSRIERATRGSLAQASSKSICSRRARFDPNDELPLPAVRMRSIQWRHTSTSAPGKSTSAAAAAAAASTAFQGTARRLPVSGLAVTSGVFWVLKHPRNKM